MRKSPSTPTKTHLLVIGVYILLALVLTYPLAFHLTTHVPGSDTWAYDEYTFIWNIWWFKYAILDLHTTPLYSGYIFYPLGISLVLHTYNLFNALVALPLESLFGLPLVSNLAIIFSSVIGGYGTFLLIEYLLVGERLRIRLSRRLAAFVGGAAFAFTASHHIYAALGHYDMVSAEWIPFYALFLIRTVRQPSYKNAVLAGLFATLAMLCEMIFGVFLGLFTLLYLLFAWRREVAGVPLRGLAPYLKLMRRLAVLAVTVLVTYGWLFVPILHEMLSEDYSLQGWGEGLKLSADLVGLFTPTALHPLWGTDWVRELRAVTEGTAHFSDVNTVLIGYGVLLVAVVAAVTRWQQVRVWATSAVLFALFSLGPVLHINGRYRFDLDGLEVTVPLPFALLHYIPIVKANRAPNRFSVVLALALAVLVGYGVAWLLSQVRASKGVWVAATSLLLVVSFEHLTLPLPLTDARVPEVFHQIAAEPGDFAILQLPLGWRNSFGTQGAERTQSQYYQTAHHKRLLSGNVSRNPPFKFAYFAHIPVLKSIIDAEFYREVDEETRTQSRALAPDLLYLYDVRYVVVLPAVPGRLPYADTRQATLDLIADVLPLETPPFYDRDGMVAYRVIQPPGRKEFVLDFGVEGSQMYRGLGWDRDEDVAGATACWAKAQGAQVFFPLRDVGDYVMTLYAVPFTYPGSPIQTVSVRVNGHEVWPAIPLTEAWGAYEVSVPTSTLRLGLNELTLDFAYLAAPRDVLPADVSIGQTGVQSPVDIEVNSGGLEGDFAYITVDGEDASTHRQGYNLAVIDPASGQVLDQRGFDTAANHYESAAMAAYLAEVPPGRIVVAAVRGDGASHLTGEAIAALHSIGAEIDLRGTNGDSHAVIGLKGATPGTALERSGKQNAWLRVGRNPDDRTLAVAVDRIELRKASNRSPQDQGALFAR